MTRLSVLVGVLGILGMVATHAWASPTPVFYSSLDDDASITSTGGVVQNSANHTYTAGVSNNAFQSTSSSRNLGGWAKWSDSTVSTLFSGYDAAQGITIDQYFQGTWTGIAANTDEGLWAMVRRDKNSGGTGDTYMFTSLRSGKIRIAFANESANQYKFTFDGNAPNLATQEYAPSLSLPLADGTPYHLTVSLKNGTLKVWLDDVNGVAYSNDTPVYTSAEGLLPSGYNWQLPPAGAVPGSQSSTGNQTREMDIGIRGFGNNANTVVNFGGSLRSGDWIDEMKVFNGEYTPADLVVTAVAGDYNHNGSVDNADYVVWKKSFGQSGVGLDADGSGPSDVPDGVVDNFDYTFWRSKFGLGAGSGSGLASNAIPEPSSVILLAIAGLTCARWRRGG